MYKFAKCLCHSYVFNQLIVFEFLLLTEPCHSISNMEVWTHENRLESLAKSANMGKFRGNCHQSLGEYRRKYCPKTVQFY